MKRKLLSILGIIGLIIIISSCDSYSSEYPRTLYQNCCDKKVIQINDSIVISIPYKNEYSDNRMIEIIKIKP